ncbi:unnamed protein product [Sphenostylis stenocarpa]|uniref:Uncharacterized protein n=1 Tax=Sphenostylis stenocarpa TaxID=92480 RepID=A0AA86SNT1_9FABA|nr:unnamed protein product [Sphenostylis stenocarpa]
MNEVYKPAVTGVRCAKKETEKQHDDQVQVLDRAWVEEHHLESTTVTILLARTKNVLWEWEKQIFLWEWEKQIS